MIVLDTHALLWWCFEPEKLSTRAVEICEAMESTRDGIVSAVSLWEIEIKVRRKKLELPISVDELVDRLEASSALSIVDADVETWLRSARLPFEHRDPADRLIVATAEVHRAQVLTKDEILHAAVPHLAVW